MIEIGAPFIIILFGIFALLGLLLGHCAACWAMQDDSRPAKDKPRHWWMNNPYGGADD